MLKVKIEYCKRIEETGNIYLYIKYKFLKNNFLKIFFIVKIVILII